MFKNNLKIYFTADLHNHKSALYALKDLHGEQNTILLDTGDAIAGNNYFGPSHEAILDMMGSLGYKAMAMGNREFNYSRKMLENRLMQASFPILSCNLKDLKGKISSLIKPYIIQEIGNFKICIIGVTPNQFPKSSTRTKITGFEFENYSDSVKACINQVKDKVSLVVVLSHIGLNDDIALAENLFEEAIILGGHSHKTLSQPMEVNKCLIFHAGCYGRYIGEITFEYKDEKKPAFCNYRLLSLPL